MSRTTADLEQLVRDAASAVNVARAQLAAVADHPDRDARRGVERAIAAQARRLRGQLAASQNVLRDAATQPALSEREREALASRDASFRDAAATPRGLLRALAAASVANDRVAQVGLLQAAQAQDYQPDGSPTGTAVVAELQRRLRETEAALSNRQYDDLLTKLDEACAAAQDVELLAADPGSREAAQAHMNDLAFAGRGIPMPPEREPVPPARSGKIVWQPGMPSPELYDPGALV